MGWEYTSPGGGSGSSLAIGNSIGNSPIANAVLFVSATGNLANSANFKWNDGVEIIAPATTDVPLSVSALAGQTAAIIQTDVNGTPTAAINAAGEFTNSPNAGNKNEAFGALALDAALTGADNTALGYSALGATTSGNWNTGIGTQALNANTGGHYNVGVGRRACYTNSTGDANIGIGYKALNINSLGNQNVAIGFEAGELVTGSGNIFIGYRAGAQETGSNTLYIDNSPTTTPLIHGDFSTDVVTINGTQTITDAGNDVLTLVSTGTGSRAGLVCDNDSSVQFQLFMGGSLHGSYPSTAALVLDDGAAFIIGHTSATPRMYVSSAGSIGIGTSGKPTANDGDMIFFQAKSSTPTLASNTCGLYGEDFSGTVRLKVQDEDGDEHFLTVAYGEIKVEGNATATTISASSTDFSNKVQVTIFDTNGLSRGTTPDHTNDHITVDDNGVYKVSAVLSFSGATGDLISFAIFKNNGATQLTTRATRELGSTDVGNASTQGLADLSINDTVEIWIQNESDSDNVTVEDATLLIEHV